MNNTTRNLIIIIPTWHDHNPNLT